jgi:hypothetical protein
LKAHFIHDTRSRTFIGSEIDASPCLKFMSKLRKRILAFGLGVIFSITAIEFFLFVLVSIQNYWFAESLSKTNRSNSSEEVFHIVVLGESTSQNWGYEVDPPWPKILEGLLNSRVWNHQGTTVPSRQFRVTSIAQAGHFSTLQVDRLIREFENLRPDAVISMMGINDSLAVHRTDSDTKFRLRILRLGQWFDIFVTCRECKSAATVEDYRSIFKSIEVRFSQKLNQILSDPSSTSGEPFSGKHLELIKASVESEIARAPQLRTATLIYSGEILRSRAFAEFWKPNRETLRPESRRRLERALQIVRDWHLSVIAEVPNHPLALVGICRPVSGTEQNTLCVDRIVELAQRGEQIPIEVLFLARNQDAASASKIDPLLRAYGYRVAGSSSDLSGKSYLATREAYQRLVRFLGKTGVDYFAMQYPTGSVNGLKEFFFSKPPEGRKSFADAFYVDSHLPLIEHDPRIAEEFHAVRFISNANFAQLIAREGEATFFVDMFARRNGLNFGHTNYRGSLEIAINARNALMNALQAQSSAQDVRSEK